MLRYAGVPSIVFLTLLQWGLAAGGLALAGRWRRPRGRGHWLAIVAASACLAGAFGGLVLMPGDGLGTYRTWLLIGVIGTIVCWGRLALIPLPAEGRGEEADATLSGATMAINRRWTVAIAAAHLALTFASAWWFCRWFIGQSAISVDAIPYQMEFLALSVVVNRAAGAVLIAYLLMGAREGIFLPEESRSPEFARRMGALARRICILTGWRMIVLGMSLALGIAAGPLGPRFLLHDRVINDSLLIGVRVLVGVIIPGFLAWLAGGLCDAGAGRAGAQQFPPALIMALIGETIGAGLSFGLTGLGL